MAGKATIITVLLSIHVLLFLASSDPDPQLILIKFKDSFQYTKSLYSWNINTLPCNGNNANWRGIRCIHGSVIGLRLANLGLKGTIDVDSLSQLPQLRTVSFRKNNFDGPIPNFTTLSSLKSIFLSHNKFSGDLPDATFKGMRALKKIDLSNNELTGPIPYSLSLLPRLIELKLNNNQFDGYIPSFPLGNLKTLNMAHNRLVGEIPRSLSNFSTKSFEGNEDLCGPPFKSCTAPNELSTGNIVVVSLLLSVAVSALVLVVIILLRKKNPTEQIEVGEGMAEEVKLVQQRKPPAAVKMDGNVKITFLKEERDNFDMSDLLKSSAEVLGSGIFGSTYKADLGNGEIVVVKRYKHMTNVNKPDFQEHFRRLGRLDHPNLQPILGYYYRKEEKLFVSDFVPNVSLAIHLHGNKSRRHRVLDWPTRLKIIKGVGEGLLYLYNELPNMTSPHGHLKSSNVLLDKSYNPLLNDYGLVPVVNQEDAQWHLISYKSPEYRQSGRITKKTDVWSLGVLIIEMVTGKLPPCFVQQGKGSEMDVWAWVESVVGEGEDVEVLDKEMQRRKAAESEIIKLLKIGLNCCQVEVENRPDIKDAVNTINLVNDNGT